MGERREARLRETGGLGRGSYRHASKAAVEDINRQCSSAAETAHVQPDAAVEERILVDDVAQRVEEILCLPQPADPGQLQLLEMTHAAVDKHPALLEPACLQARAQALALLDGMVGGVATRPDAELWAAASGDQLPLQHISAVARRLVVCGALPGKRVQLEPTSRRMTSKM